MDQLFQPSGKWSAEIIINLKSIFIDQSRAMNGADQQLDLRIMTDPEIHPLPITPNDPLSIVSKYLLFHSDQFLLTVPSTKLEVQCPQLQDCQLSSGPWSRWVTLRFGQRDGRTSLEQVKLSKGRGRWDKFRHGDFQHRRQAKLHVQRRSSLAQAQYWQQAVAKSAKLAW